MQKAYRSQNEAVIFCNLNYRCEYSTMILGCKNVKLDLAFPEASGKTLIVFVLLWIAPEAHGLILHAPKIKALQ